MKKTRLSLLLAVMFLSTASFAQNWWKSSIRGEGDVVSQDLDLNEFDGISLAFSGDVYLTQGETQSVTVEAQQNIIDNITTEVEGRHWKIRFDRPVRSAKSVKVYITMKTLDKAIVSGSGSIISQEAFTDIGDLRLGVSGSGNIDLELAARGAIDGQISGSGNIELHGRAAALDGAISGSGNIRAYDLEVGSGMVQISGSGNAQVNVTGELEVRISGSGDVTYKGRPTALRSKVSGSGDVNAY